MPSGCVPPGGGKKRPVRRSGKTSPFDRGARERLGFLREIQRTRRGAYPAQPYFTAIRRGQYTTCFPFHVQEVAIDGWRQERNDRKGKTDYFRTTRGRRG